MNRSGFSLTDLIAALVLLVMVGLFSLAATVNLDNARTRVKCASNLRQIGQAILLYSNDTKGSYPRTKYDRGSADQPTAYTGYDGPADPFSPGCTQRNDVSAALYNLLRTEDVTSKVFTCPATQQRAEDFGGGIRTAQDKSNFRSGETLSYSYADPYPDAASAKRGYRLYMGNLNPAFAVAADMNPGSPSLLQLTTSSSVDQIRAGNSANHSGDGQNVLYADGHVEFNNNPFCGINRDNIYTCGPSGNDPNTGAPLPTGGTAIFGSPIGPNDSVLLPAVIMPTMAVAAAPAAPADAAPVAAAPPPPVDQGMDFTNILMISSLLFLIVLLIAVAILVMRSKRSQPADKGPTNQI